MTGSVLAVPDAAADTHEGRQHSGGCTLGELAAAVPGVRLDSGSPDAVVTGVTHDSHSVGAGQLYAALPGEHTHGAHYAQAAIDGGAIALFTDDTGAAEARATGAPTLLADDARLRLGPVASVVYGEPSRALSLFGVTGTNGKTTTAYLIEAGLRAAGHSTGLIGTIETRIGAEVVPSQRTTPEASELQSLLAAMVHRGVSAAAMEVSSHALALHRVDATRFTVALFTNLSQDHLDFHGDLESYFAAKARLFTSEFCDRAVIDIDDQFGKRLADMTAIDVVTVAQSAGADWTVSDVDSSLHGSTFVLRGRDGTHLAAKTALAGEFNVRNAALAIVGLIRAGVEPGVAIRGVGECDRVPGRMERVDTGQPFLGIVDYAHTPDAVAELLNTLRPLVAGRLIVVIGCGGDRDQAKRPLMGAAAAAGADAAVFTNDNPRSEDPAAIIAAMVSGVASAHRDRVLVEPDRRAAIRAAVALAGAGDAVVVAGKGHERTQETGGVRVPFDDVGELRAAIAAAAR
jgi:UDP-N-acetylmuramoyl-L-alanyl-D-glutamate--2,6-diaminopimelate ligase